jgi:hypothetical protein
MVVACVATSKRGPAGGRGRERTRLHHRARLSASSPEGPPSKPTTTGPVSWFSVMGIVPVQDVGAFGWEYSVLAVRAPQPRVAVAVQGVDEDADGQP